MQVQSQIQYQQSQIKSIIKDQNDIPLTQNLLQQFKFEFLCPQEEIYVEPIIFQIIKDQIIIQRNLIDYEFRNKLMSILIGFHRKLKLNKNVLFDAVNILDRYLSSNPYISCNQLITLVILGLSQKKASQKKFKYNSWINKLDVNLKSQEVCDIEAQILFKLNFDLEMTNSLQIASMIIQSMKMDEKTYLFCRYLLQLSFFLVENGPILSQILIGACCVHLSCFFLGPSLWNDSICQKLQLSQNDVRYYCGQLFNVVLNSQIVPYEQIYKKYKKSCYKKISQMKFQLLENRSRTPETSCQQEQQQNCENDIRIGKIQQKKNKQYKQQSQE